MPLTKKGEEIMRAMKESYGGSKGEQVFYASKNAGKISGVDCDMDQRDFNRAKAARDFKLERDMSPEEFSRLRELLDEWVEEEAEEPEHAQDEWSPEAREAAAKARNGASGGSEVHKYNPSAVNQAISQSERRGGKVGGKERSAIHRLLKGRHDADKPRLWRVRGTNHGRPSEIKIRAEDYNDAVKKASGPGHMMVVKEVFLVEG